MECAKPKISRKTILLPIIGLSAFFLYILLFNVDIPQIIATAQTANPLIYSAAVIVSLAEVFFYAASWCSILSNLQVKITILRSYIYVWYGTFMDIVIPAESISGEVCRVYLVSREQSGTGGKVVASVVTQRLLGMGMNVIFLVAGISLLFTDAKIDPIIFDLILFFTVIIAAIMALLLLVSTKENWSTKLITALIKAAEFVTRGKWKQLSQIREVALKDLRIFHDSMKELMRRPKNLFFPTALLAINWLCSLSVVYLVFLSLGYQIPWSIVLITASIVVAVKSIPIGVPFEVGLPEITMTTLYTSMGVPAGLSATATILSRIITLWLRFGIGFASQQWVEIKSALKPKLPTITEKT
jgi:uncharacterized protein (TIRG00374 family)